MTRQRSTSFLLFLLFAPAIVLAQGSQDETPSIEAMLAKAEKAAAAQRARIVEKVNEAVTAFASNDPIDTGRFRKSLCRLGTGAIDPLVDAFSRATKKRAIEQIGLTLVEMGADSITAKLLPLAQDKNQQRAAVAITAIGRLGDPMAVAVIRGVHALPPSDEVKATAILALALLKVEDAQAITLAGLSDKSPTLRRESAKAAAVLGDSSLIEAVLAIVDDDDASVSREAIRALGSFDGSSDVRRRLHELLADRDDDIVFAAVRAIAKHSVLDASKRRLREVAAKRERARYVRVAAARALYAMGDNKGVESLATRYKKDLRRPDRRAFAQQNLADLYWDVGDYRRAATALGKTITPRTAPEDVVETHERIARCHARLKKWSDAAKSLKKARGTRWADLADDDDFAPMASDSKYSKNFVAK